ncbi:hypothetical protein B0H14DRAFT_3122978 [Mycena olivaceomarginata]|nr:hypothetical protein B0H14DRAFT_3122978 [Mycena olivaceomarginata]
MTTTLATYRPIRARARQEEHCRRPPRPAGVQFSSGVPSPASRSSPAASTKNAVHYEEKAASGLRHASLLLPAFLENLYTRPLLKQSDARKIQQRTGQIHTHHADLQAERHAGVGVDRAETSPPQFLALLTNYTDPDKRGRLMGSPSTQKCRSPARRPTGLLARDEMFASHAEYSGLYTATPVPNPDLVALGMQFSTVEEFFGERACQSKITGKSTAENYQSGRERNTVVYLGK